MFRDLLVLSINVAWRFASLLSPININIYFLVPGRIISKITGLISFGQSFAASNIMYIIKWRFINEQCRYLSKRNIVGIAKYTFANDLMTFKKIFCKKSPKRCFANNYDINIWRQPVLHFGLSNIAKVNLLSNGWHYAFRGAVAIASPQHARAPHRLTHFDNFRQRSNALPH